MLPEMFSTGFCTDRPDLAEPLDGPTMRTLQQLADDTGVAIIGSFICAENSQLYNRGFFMKPNEHPVFIDKAHLYKHGGEDLFFTKGNDRTVFTYKGVRIRLLICYDLRFPVWARNGVMDSNNYEILLVIANWPEIRIGAYDVLLRARAIENQCYVAAVNPVGDDALGLHYNGHSVALDTRLTDLAGFADNEEGTKIVDFDLTKLRHFRETLPLWKDADEFELQNGL